MRLLDLAGEFAALSELVEGVDDDGVVLTDEAVAAALAYVQLALDARVEACCRVIGALKAEAAALDVEEQRLAARRGARIHAIERLRAYVLLSLQTAGIRALKSPTYSVSVAQGPPHCVIREMDAIPQEYLSTIVKPRTGEISAALKAGRLVPGAELETGSDVLRIR